MSKYNFDTVISRKGSGDLMHGALKPRWGRDDLFPMWVADMDFAVCPDILNALRKRLEHPILGYTVMPEDYYPTIHNWLLTHQHWDIQPEWLGFVPGVVKGIAMAVTLFVKPDEKVMVVPPVYHPFFLTAKALGREVAYCPLEERERGVYTLEEADLEKAYDEKCRLLVFANPHNPVGISWSEDTLRMVAEFCQKHDMIVISDEIHCDLTLPGHEFHPLAACSEAGRQCSITFQAPTKTFNIAGLTASFTLVPNPEIRRKFFGFFKATELNEPDIFGPIATIAAYEHGDEWRKEMLSYVEGNMRFAQTFINEHMPRVRMVFPQASFLIWLDCRDLHLSHSELLDFFIDKAHLALNDGEMFGPGGQGHMRMNVGMPRSLVRKGLEQLAEAYQQQGF